MFELFYIPAFRTLFAAQIIALIGTGLTTIALALLAFELAGNQAGIPGQPSPGRNVDRQ